MGWEAATSRTKPRHSSVSHSGHPREKQVRRTSDSVPGTEQRDLHLTKPFR